MNDFPENLRIKRTAANMTRQELADIVGVSLSTIGQYEQGRREPDLQKLIAIAAALHSSVDMLLGYHMDEYAHYKTVFLAACPDYGIKEDGDKLQIYSKEEEKALTAAPLSWNSEFPYDESDALPPHVLFDFLPEDLIADGPDLVTVGYLPLEMTRAAFIGIMKQAEKRWKDETKDQFTRAIYMNLSLYKRYQDNKKSLPPDKASKQKRP